MSPSSAGLIDLRRTSPTTALTVHGRAKAQAPLQVTTADTWMIILRAETGVGMRLWSVCGQ